MKNKHSETTLLTLANAAELTAIVVQELAGNEVASQINGSPLTRAVIHDMAMTSFQTAMSRKIGGR